MFGIVGIEWGFHPKRNAKKEIILFVNYHKLEMIHG
jgi:hypothetical protein